jgi:hypothetical protein
VSNPPKIYGFIGFILVSRVTSKVRTTNETCGKCTLAGKKVHVGGVQDEKTVAKAYYERIMFASLRLTFISRDFTTPAVVFSFEEDHRD